MATSLLLIDTNIISQALVPSHTAAYAALFKDLEAKYDRFVVSGFTKYELMCSSDKEHRAKIDNYIANDMILISLSQPLMDFAARVCFLYGHHKSTKGHKIGMGDIVNASLAIIKKCPILTMDNNDYPTPFFQEIDRRRVTYDTGKNKEMTDTVYILKPDLENLRTCFEAYEV
jgi:Predicted nucleic acid-binding protein, contains PIN domain